MEGIKTSAQNIQERALIYSFRESKGDLPLSSVTGSPWLDSVRAVLTGAEQIEQIEQPRGFCGELRPYQRMEPFMALMARGDRARRMPG